MTDDAYRNMKEYLRDHPSVIEAAQEAVRGAGLEPRPQFVRGGTDGSRLSELGLPTPNIFTGGHDFRSRHEWIRVADMGAAASTIVHLVQRSGPSNRAGRFGSAFARSMRPKLAPRTRSARDVAIEMSDTAITFLILATVVAVFVWDRLPVVWSTPTKPPSRINDRSFRDIVQRIVFRSPRNQTL